MIHVKNMTKSLGNGQSSGLKWNRSNKKRLLAGISHDIRTPLTAIKAYAEGVHDGIAPTEEQQKHTWGLF